MRLPAIVVVVAAVGLLSLSGCSGPPIDGARFHLPGFGAPEQWEPELDETTAQTPSDT